VGICIREADLDRELPLLMSTLNDNFHVQLPRDRFRWLYFDNPDGRAVAWFAIDDSSGEIVGSTAVTPRRIRVGPGSHVVAWNCGDFSIRPRYRTMGVALKLRRAARDAVDAGARPFLYAHPNDRMLPVHLKSGHAPLGRMVRQARRMRMDSGSRVFNAMGTFALRRLGRELFVRRRDDVELLTSEAGPAFDDLYERASRRLVTALVRDASYVRWRFQSMPLEQHEILVSRRGNTLTGYLAFLVRDRVGHVKDWLAVDDSARDQLFAGFVRTMNRRDVFSLSVIALESHPDLPVWRRFGFLLRPESSTAITYISRSFSGRAEVSAPQAWYMTVGDRDV
jgi:GNAT superfamily N-acetyltransferase